VYVKPSKEGLLLDDWQHFEYCRNMCCTTADRGRDDRRTTMKWVTGSSGRVDGIACAWFTKRFVDPAREFLFVPEGQFADGT
jgi:Chromate resistance exported protein